MISFKPINNIYAKPKTGVILTLVLGIFFVMLFLPNKAEAAWNASYIISDSEFGASGTMSEAQIQDFLFAKGSYLTNYNMPGDSYIGPNNNINAKGWSAAHVIWQVSQWYGMNPQVVLTTLQKEQSLVTTGGYNDWGINWAMGYAVTDSGIVSACTTAYNPGGSCSGFAMQLDWGTWQLRYNMDKANTECAKVSPYCTGNVITIDGVGVYIGNGATASLYRYTPHFHGNQNFYTIYNSWFTPYDYEFVSAINPPAYVGAGDTASAQLKIRNIGSATWKNDSQDSTNPLRLYVASGGELYSEDGSWASSIRIKMTTPQVAQGEVATFDFTVHTPMTIGTYYLKMIPRAEAVGNMKDLNMIFGVTTPQWHAHQFISAINPPATMQPGQNYDVQIVLKNKGSAVWNSDAVDPSFRPMRLAVISGSPNFYEATTWVNNSKIKMTTPTAKYNQLAYFTFKMKAPNSPGVYVIKFTPIIENLIQYPDIGMAFGSTVVGNGSAYRYWNKVRGGHFYTANAQEKTAVENDPNWQPEGIAFGVSYVSGANASPVYRFWNGNLKSHFYTISTTEKNSLINNPASGWQYEGIVWYSSQQQAPGYTPVYRFWSDFYKRHFYTKSLAEKNYVESNYPSNIWEYEGISWYSS